MADDALTRGEALELLAQPGTQIYAHVELDFSDAVRMDREMLRKILDGADDNEVRAITTSWVSQHLAAMDRLPRAYTLHLGPIWLNGMEVMPGED